MLSGRVDSPDDESEKPSDSVAAVIVVGVALSSVKLDRPLVTAGDGTGAAVADAEKDSDEGTPETTLLS